MDFATEMTDALSNGALAAGAGLATSVVNDLYSGLKGLLAGRFGRRAMLDALEEDPSSGTQRAAVTEALSKSGAADDPEVRDLARRLAEALAGMEPAHARAMGLDIEDLRAASVRLADIASGGTAVRMRRVSVSGSFEAEGIRGGQGATTKN